MANEFLQEYSDFMIEQFNFLPSFEIRLMDKAKRSLLREQGIDIFEDDKIGSSNLKINYKKFQKYIRI